MKANWKCGAAPTMGRLWIPGLAAYLLAALAIPTSAATVYFCLSVDFSAIEPGSGCPCCPSGEWLTVTINDVAPGHVSLTISAERLMNQERVQDLYLNLNPGLNAEDLRFTEPTSVGSFSLPGIQLGTNAYKAANDGLFDIRFAFDCTPSTCFGPGETLTYLVTIDGGTLKAADFEFWSEPSGEPGSAGPFLAASHILGTGQDGELSAWIGAIPEPAMCALFSLGMLTLCRRRRD